MGASESSGDVGQAQLASRCEEAERQLSVLTAEAAAAREKADALCAEVEAVKGRWEGSAKEAEAAWYGTPCYSYSTFRIIIYFGNFEGCKAFSERTHRTPSNTHAPIVPTHVTCLYRLLS